MTAIVRSKLDRREPNEWWERSTGPRRARLRRAKVLEAIKAGLHPNEICRLANASGALFSKVRAELIDEGLI